MKRLIAAVSFAVLAVPAVAAESGKPFEQLDLDRALPQINLSAVEARSVDTRSLPYEQLAIDRTLPNVGARAEHRQLAASGSTRSDVEIAVDAQAVGSSGYAGLATGPWANDHNFIAPAQ
jgi:hypothetical protein